MSGDAQYGHETSTTTPPDGCTTRDPEDTPRGPASVDVTELLYAVAMSRENPTVYPLCALAAEVAHAADAIEFYYRKAR